MKYSARYEVNNDTPDEKKRYIQNLFNTIVPTYDLLNRVLSGGIDMLWRVNIFRHIKNVRNLPVLDLCCGTGDLSKLLFRKGAALTSLDFSVNMILEGKKKGRLPGGVVAADATKLPFVNGSYQAATVAFGIRNIPDLDRFIKEVHRVLKPSGQFVILELVRPKNPIIRLLYGLYLGKLLPIIGGIVSGERFAYEYLSTTIETFLDPSDLEIILKKYGFETVEHFPQTFGISTIMVCTKGDK